MAFTLYVKDLSPRTSFEDLVIYFQSENKSGGGDIDTEASTLDGNKAIIVFEEEESLERVLKKQHTLDKCNLTISRTPFKERPKAKKRERLKTAGADSTEDQKPSSEQATLGEVRTVIVSGINPDTTDDSLEMFFENKKRSGGGEIEKIQRIESDVVHVTFNSSEDATNVLKKGHLELEGYNLHLKEKQPELLLPRDKKRLYVENIDPKTTKDSLINYMELATGCDVLEVQFGTNGNALITIAEERDMSKVKLRSNRPLEGAILKITNPPVCNSILITGLSKNTTQTAIELKFENSKYGGGKIYGEIDYQKDKGEAVVSFCDPNVIHTLMSMEQKLNQSTLVLKPWYPFMEENRSERREKKIVIPVKPDVMDYVSNKCEQDFRDSFGFPVAETSYDEEKGELTVTAGGALCSEETVTAVQDYFSEFTVKEIGISKKLMENLIEKLKQMISSITKDFGKEADATIDREKRCIQIVGKRNDAEELHKLIKQEVEEIERQSSIVTTDLSLDQCKLTFLLFYGFEEKLQTECNVEVTIDPPKEKLQIKGSQEHIVLAKTRAFEEYTKVKEETISLDEIDKNFLESGGLQNLNDDLKRSQFQAMICLGKSNPAKAKVEFYGTTEYEKIQEYLSQRMHKASFEVDNDSLGLLNNTKWFDFRDKLGKDHSLNLLVDNSSGCQIWLTGERKQVEQGYVKLQEFMTYNTIVSEDITAGEGLTKHLSSFCQEEIDRIEKKLEEHQVKVRPSRNNQGFLVHGTKEGVKKAIDMIQTVLNGLAVNKIPIDKPRFREFLQSPQGKISLDGIESRQQCTFLLTNDSAERARQISSIPRPQQSHPTSNLLCSYKTPENILFKVYQGDLTTHECDVIVNAANGDLQHIGGLAKSILDAGGKQIQDDCDAYVAANGRLFEGECYSGIPGKLPCRRLIHTVGPRWNTAKRVMHQKILESACTKTLEAAKGYSTIAIPAIGSGVFGVPKDVCAETLVKASVEYSSNTESETNGTLKEIHFVNNDQMTAQKFVAQFTKMFADKPTFNDNQFRPNRKQPAHQGKRSGVGRSAPLHETTDDEVAGVSRKQTGDFIMTATKVNISIIVGDLSTHKADVLVNTTSENLQLSSNPCSQALSKEAGPILQQECNKIGKINVGEVAVTNAGQLLCKKVYHVTCAQWNNGQGEQVLRSIVKKCLEKSHSSGMTSIAFPAIGTGVLGFPHKVTAKICFEEVKEFGKRQPNSCIKDVHFVVYHQDQASIKAFKDELRNQPEWGNAPSETATGKTNKKPSRKSKRKAKTQIESSEHQPQTKAEARTDDTTKHIINDGGKISVQIGDDTEIEIVQGDITKEKTDAIAHLSNLDLSMHGKVAAAIIKAGGKEIETESKKHQQVSKHSVVITEAGRLDARYIAHMAAPNQPDSNDIEKSIINCLKEVAKRRCNTISFPAVATGTIGISAEKSAKAMLTAIARFLQSDPGSLKTVRIVIFDRNTFDSFSKVLKNLPQADDGSSPGLLRSLFNSVVSLWRSDSEKITMEESDNSEKPSLFLHIYGKDNKTVKKAEEMLNSIISGQMRKQKIEDDNIEKLSLSQISQIEETGKKNEVKVTIDQSINRVILFGYSEDVSTVMVEINSILNDVKIAEHEKETAEMVSQLGVQWFWIDSDGSHEEYDVPTNSLIEKAYIKKEESVTFQLEEGWCQIDFGKMRETNLETKEETEVIRKDPKVKGDVSVPDYWDPQPKDASGKELTVHIVQLDPKNANHQKEYKKLSDGFNKTAGNRTIQKIERIQNPDLYKLYALKKQSMDEKEGSNEMLLYHGTHPDRVPIINLNGLNRSYAGGAHGTAHGRGVYFGRDASLSVGYAKADNSGNFPMYVAKVAVGQYAKSQSNMIVPPPKSGNVTYDSVVDNVSNPGIFVLFYDNQYYPEYLITFR